MKNYQAQTGIFILLLFFCSCGQAPSSTPSENGGKADQVQLKGQSAVNDDVSEPHILNIAIGSKDHSTLVAAVQAAELEDVLTNAGPPTDFAPTNEAFEKLT